MGVFSLAQPVRAASDGFPRIAILGLFKNMVIMRVNGVKRVLRKGKTSPEGIKLISSSSHAALIEFNGKQQRLKLGQDRGGVFTSAAKQSLTLWPDRSGMYRSKGSINGKSLNFLIDTGATLVAMSGDQAKRLRLDYGKSNRPIRVSTASGMTHGYHVMLDRVQIGSIVLHKIDAMIIEGSHPSEVLLGMSFLKRVKMQREGSAMILER